LSRLVTLPRLVLCAVAAMLLLPHVFSMPRVPDGFDTGLVPPDMQSIQFGLPRVFSGDEPHYLVQLYSLVEDGDLDVANNYAAAREGSYQAGSLAGGTPLDRHTSWYIGNEYHEFGKDYEPIGYVDGNGRKWFDFFLREGVSAPEAQYSRHPPGLALLLWPIAAPFRGTDLVEPVALLCSGLAVVAALYYFNLLIEPYVENRQIAALVAALVFLGTPIWHYGRTLFTEPYLLALTVAGFALFLRRAQYLAAGALLGVAAFLKAPYLLVAVPPAVYLLAQRRFKAALLYGLPLFAAVLAILATNYYQFGSPLRGPQQFEWANPLTGAGGQWLSLNHGLLLFAPICVVALLLWPRFYRLFPRDAALALASFGVYYGLLSFYECWYGGFCYGPRYLVPLLPLLLLPLATLRKKDFTGKPLKLAATSAVAVLSLLFNGFAALPYWTSWNMHPGICLFIRLIT